MYEVDQKMLEFLDEFEGYFDYYIRLKAQVICSNTNEHLNAWIYFINRYKPEMLQLPLLSNYDSYGEHGLRYVERYGPQDCGENVASLKSPMSAFPKVWVAAQNCKNTKKCSVSYYYIG